MPGGLPPLVPRDPPRHDTARTGLRIPDRTADRVFSQGRWRHHFIRTGPADGLARHRTVAPASRGRAVADGGRAGAGGGAAAHARTPGPRLLVCDETTAMLDASTTAAPVAAVGAAAGVPGDPGCRKTTRRAVRSSRGARRHVTSGYGCRLPAGSDHAGGQWFTRSMHVPCAAPRPVRRWRCGPCTDGTGVPLPPAARGVPGRHPPGGASRAERALDGDRRAGRQPTGSRCVSGSPNPPEERHPWNPSP